MSLNEARKITAVERDRLRSMEHVSGLSDGRLAVVVAGGEGVVEAWDDLIEVSKHPSVDVIAINDFFRSPLSAEIEPWLYVLSDPSHVQRHVDPHLFGQSVWHYLGAHKSVRVALPARTELQTYQRSDYWFQDRPGLPWSKSTDIRKAHGYEASTAYRAVALGIHLGFKAIFLVGFDMSQYTHFSEVDGQLAFDSSSYFYTRATASTPASADSFPDEAKGALCAQARLIDNLSIFASSRLVHVSSIPIDSRLQRVNPRDLFRAVLTMA